MTDRSAALAMREAAAKLCDDLATAFQHQHDGVGQNVGTAKNILRTSIDTCKEIAIGVRALPLPDEPAPGGAAWRAGMTAEQNAIIDRLVDSQYAAGAKFGWNCAVEDDEQRYQSCINDRVVGHKEAIRKAKEADASIAPVPPPEVDVMGLLDKFEKAAIEVGYDTGASSARVESSGKKLDGLRAALAAQLQRWTG